MLHLRRLAHTRHVKSVAPSPSPPAFTLPAPYLNGGTLREEDPSGGAVPVHCSIGTSVRGSDLTAMSDFATDTVVHSNPLTERTEISVKRRPGGLVPIYPDSSIEAEDGGG